MINKNLHHYHKEFDFPLSQELVFDEWRCETSRSLWGALSDSSKVVPYSTIERSLLFPSNLLVSLKQLLLSPVQLDVLMGLGMLNGFLGLSGLNDQGQTFRLGKNDKKEIISRFAQIPENKKLCNFLSFIYCTNATSRRKDYLYHRKEYIFNTNLHEVIEDLQFPEIKNITSYGVLSIVEKFFTNYKNALRELGLSTSHCSVFDLAPMVPHIQKITYQGNDNTELLKTLTHNVEGFVSLKNLETLHVYRGLEEFPTYITQMKNLKNLYLNRGGIQNVPESIGNLINLEELILTGNKIDVLPPSVGNLKSLRILDIRSNNLVAIPEGIGMCRSLQNINFYRNMLGDLPESFRFLKNLSWLNCGNNKNISTIPHWIGDLSALKELGFDTCALEFQLPESLAQLSLECLYLGHNRLKESDLGVLGSMSTLTTLDLSGNQLSCVPESLKNLHNLTTLQLNKNQISVLPDWLFELPLLENLYIGDNNITRIPDSIVNHKTLKRLGIYGEKISQSERERVKELLPNVAFM